MNDALLKLYPATGQLGTISAAGVVAGATGVFAGRNRTYNVVPRIGGDVTGTTPSLSFILEHSDVLASGYVQVPGTGTINLSEMWGAVTPGAPAGAKPEIPTNRSAAPRIGVTTTKDYLRATLTAGGTSPVYPNVSIYLEPIDTTSKISGS